MLTLGGGQEVEVADQHQLSVLLEGLCTLRNGQAAALERGQADFIKAKRHGEFWSVTAKRGRMWTAQSFTAAMTSDYAERRTQEARACRSLRQRLMRWLRSRPPEQALSTKQVRTLFTEYLSGQRFTLPMSGA
jgi:hypothetical protein